MPYTHASSIFLMLRIYCLLSSTVYVIHIVFTEINNRKLNMLCWLYIFQTALYISSDYALVSLFASYHFSSLHLYQISISYLYFLSRPSLSCYLIMSFVLRPLKHPFWNQLFRLIGLPVWRYHSSAKFYDYTFFLFSMNSMFFVITNGYCQLTEIHFVVSSYAYL